MDNWDDVAGVLGFFSGLVAVEIVLKVVTGQALLIDLLLILLRFR